MSSSSEFKVKDNFYTIRWWDDNELLLSIRFTFVSGVKTFVYIKNIENHAYIDISGGDIILSAQKFNSHCISCQITSPRTVSHIGKQCWFPNLQHRRKMSSPNPTARCGCVGTAIQTGICVLLLGAAVALVVIIYHQRTRLLRGFGNGVDTPADVAMGGQMPITEHDDFSASVSSLSSPPLSPAQISNVTQETIILPDVEDYIHMPPNLR